MRDAVILPSLRVQYDPYSTKQINIGLSGVVKSFEESQAQNEEPLTEHK